VIFILNAVNNSVLFRFLENSTLNYLGKISYGMYMYHTLVIIIVSQFFIGETEINNTYFTYLAFTILFTIAISHLSYNYIEKPFFNLKKKYMVIKSSNLRQ